MKKSNRRNTSVKFTLMCSQGNTIVDGVPLGAIGDWVGRLGGDDLCVEELIYFKSAECNGVKFEIKEREEKSDDQ